MDQEEKQDFYEDAVEYDENEDFDTRNELWIVKIHPDTGQVFYQQDTEDDLGFVSWDNPTELNQFGMEIRNTEDELDSQDVHSSVEKLIGFNHAPCSFSDEISDKFRNTLAQVFPIEIKEENEQEMLINIPLWPQHYDPYSPTDHFSNFIVLIFLPEHVASIMKQAKFLITKDHTVKSTIDDVFVKFQKTHSKPIDPNGPDHYILKVTGINSYLRSHNRPICHYDYIRHCRRNEIDISLSLIRLSPKESEICRQKDEVEVEEEQRCSRTQLDLDEMLSWLVPPPLMASNHTWEEHWDQIDHLPLEKVTWPFRVRVLGIQNLNPSVFGISGVFVEVGLYYCTQALYKDRTPATTAGANPRWAAKWMTSKLHMNAVPPTTRCVITVFGISDGKEKPIAGVALQMVDHSGRLITGRQRTKLRIRRKGQPFNLISGACGENVAEDNPMVLYFEFDEYLLPVVAQPPNYHDFLSSQAFSSTRRASELAVAPTPTLDESSLLNDVMKKDSLYELSQVEKNLLWKYRYFCSRNPTTLAKVLRSVDWTSANSVVEVRRILGVWEPLNPLQAMELFDVKFSDPVVRAYAVLRIAPLNDRDLAEYLLQLTQVLKYESSHDTPLARFLIRRALDSPMHVGHNFFWHLKSEMHVHDICQRYGLILEAYLTRCGHHLRELTKQNDVVEMLTVVADGIKTVEKSSRVPTARKRLGELNAKLPSRFELCLTNKFEVKSIIVDKCKVMSSKKLPLWVVFENADANGSPINVIFKSGDDLRQDLMTLQMIRIMDKLWMEENLDLRLKPYGCVSTGDEVGMLEVVMNSRTTADIQTKYGGRLGALMETPINAYLQEHNKDRTSLEKAIENFVRSCAGYCVATYVLGIGDRHNDNIMVTESGHLFHIDFGHFLGNFKAKFGIKRERAPFVFTPEMAYVMGGKRGDRFQQFVDLCCQAYNILRKNGSFLMNLFVLMVPAGMPELLEAEDISYMREMLSLDLTDTEASEKFKKEINNCLSNTFRRVDNTIHIFRHA